MEASGSQNHSACKVWAPLVPKTIQCVRLGRIWVHKAYCAEGLAASGSTNHSVRKVSLLLHILGRIYTGGGPCFFSVRRAVGTDLKQPRWLHTLDGLIPGGRAAPWPPPAFCFGTAGGRNRLQAYFWYIYRGGVPPPEEPATSVVRGTGIFPCVVPCLLTLRPVTPPESVDRPRFGVA